MENTRLPSPLRALCAPLLLACLAACAGVPVYPARPSANTGAPVADPVPSRVVVHLAATSEGLRAYLDSVLPPGGGGTFELRGTKGYKWTRGPLSVRFADGRVQVGTQVTAQADLPLVGSKSAVLDLVVTGEPVITTEWKARMQGAKVEVTSKDLRLRMGESVGGLLQIAKAELERFIEGYSYDLTPLVSAAYQKVAKPIPLPLGDAKGCATLKITALEAGPTVLAGGFEKDLAMVVAPSVTLPCAEQTLSATPPPLSNVAALPSGPFTVTVPIAARYEELTRAMALAFTDGKLFFSKEFPQLYMTEPELYASSSDQLVLKLRLAGPVKAGFFSANLDGNLYFAGHPVVIDNELRLPDLEPTVETSTFLLALKAKLDGNGIRDQARQALKLDLGERLGSVRAKLSSDLALAGAQGCLRSEVHKIEIAGVYPHASYLRIYVNVTAQAGVLIPCPGAPAAATPPRANPAPASATPAAPPAAAPAPAAAPTAPAAPAATPAAAPAPTPAPAPSGG
jgi:hypothetical protein